MDIKQAQRIIRSAWYPVDVNGVIGTLTMAAVRRIEANGNLTDRASLSWPRRLFAAAQVVLRAQGYYPGVIDGLVGPVTRAAVSAWSASNAQHKAAPPVLTVPTGSWPKRKDKAAMVERFGRPGSTQATAGRCELPIPHRLAWNTGKLITGFPCNSAVAGHLTAIFSEAVKHYGAAEYEALGLDLWGGCYANRKMRGSATSVSTHAYGVAVDLDPARNRLRWGSDKASMARADYDAWWRIVEATGAVSLGRVKNYDWMHFQFCKE